MAGGRTPSSATSSSTASTPKPTPPPPPASATGTAGEEWGRHADHSIKHFEGLVWPKQFVLGGGITKNPEKWLQYLHTRTPIGLAQLIKTQASSVTT